MCIRDRAGIIEKLISAGFAERKGKKLIPTKDGYNLVAIPVSYTHLIVQDQVWNRVTINRSEGKATRYYIDEFHLLLKEEQTAAYSVETWKRFRKWGGIPTGITQNVKVRPDRALCKAV